MPSSALFTYAASRVLLTLTALTFAQPRASAREIVARYVESIGGKDAVLKLTSLKQFGTMEIPALGISAKMVVQAAAPNLTTSTTSLPGVGDIVRGFDGSVGWEINPMQGSRLLKDQELMLQRESADFYASKLYLADRYTSQEVIGDTTIAGEMSHKVRMIAKGSGAESITLFSAATGLVTGGTITQATPGGLVSGTFTQGGYKRFGAVLMPTKTTITTGGQTMIITITDIVLNGVSPTAFAIPAQVLPLVKRLH